MLNHQGTVQLETERLILRRFEKNDAICMYKNWASKPEVTKYVTWFPHKSVEETQQIIDLWIDEYVEANRYQWAIVLKSTNEPIGSIGVVRQKEDAQVAEMGYCIGNDFWHQGYTSEALLCVMSYLFEKIGFNRIAALHDVRNPNSGGVMKKCGMKYEGTMRDVGLTKEGEFLTVSLYAILRSDWKKEK